jgi:hypothetical protein
MRTIRNRSDREDLIRRINNLTGKEKAAWGRMNINQMVSHLVQAGELPFSESLPDRSSFFSRTIVKPLILYVLPMPKEVKTSPEMNQQENGRKPLEFYSDRDLVIEAINKLADLPVDHDCKYHPFFGKMNTKESLPISTSTII